MKLPAALGRIWYAPRPPPALLRPLAQLYARIADDRAARQQAHAVSLPVPVVVIGNIAVGGTGKTPLTLALAGLLRELGRHPGVVSRGYGGRGPFPIEVSADTPVEHCGDEPLLIAGAGLPICCAPDRVAAARTLLSAHPQVDVILADDGLQHYRLARDLEIGVIDGVRGHGNGWRLPAGPLREPPERLARCALLLVNGADPAPYGACARRFDLLAQAARRLTDGRTRPLREFAGAGLHAVAGIGRPERFFDTLRGFGLRPRVHAFADHHRYQAADLDFGDDAPVLMTEKDAVKCRRFDDPRLWAVPVQAHFDAATGRDVRDLLAALPRPKRAGAPSPSLSSADRP